MNKLFKALDNAQPGRLADDAYEQQINDHIDGKGKAGKPLTPRQMSNRIKVIEREREYFRDIKKKNPITEMDIYNGTDKFKLILECDTMLTKLDEEENALVNMMTIKPVEL